MKPAVGFPVALVLTCLLAAFATFFYTVKPIFVAVEALAESRKLGVLTPELEVLIRAEEYKSSLVVYATWGLVAGVIGAIASTGRGLGIRLIVGAVLGVVLGALTNYISNQYALRSDPPMDAIQYWIKRYSLVQLPMAVAIAIPASFGSWANLPTNLVKAALAGVFAACLYSFLMGLATPLEQVQFNYPQFTANSIILLLSFNLLAYLGIVWGGGKPKTKGAPDAASAPATSS